MSFINLSLAHPVVRTSETKTGQLLAAGARYVMDGADAEGRVSLIEHPIGPKTLVCPMHLHTREDEYSFILEGRWGFQLGDDVVYAEPGDLVYKPRNVWHSFWNTSDTPGRLLEVISPSGFEHYFVELADMFEKFGPDRPELFEEINAKYGLSMDFDSVPVLAERHGLATEAPASTPA